MVYLPDVRQFMGTASPDVVLALDCAYHFHLRVDFFKEVFKMLRAGGKIALADVCLADGVRMDNLNPLKRFGLRQFLKRVSIPPENLMGMQAYKQKLEECGFESVSITIITEHVMEGLLQFTAHVHSRFGSILKTHKLAKLRSVASFLRTVITRKLLEYVIVVAVKGDTKDS